MHWGRGIAPLALIFVLILYPLGVLLVQIFFPDLFAFNPSGRFSLSVLRTLGQDPLFWRSTIDSLALGLSVAVAATALGSWFGYVLVRTRLWRPGIWQSLLWLLFFAPSFMVSEGVMLFAIQGGVASGLGIWSQGLSQVIFSPFGVALVLTVKLMPYAAITVSSALQSVGQEYEDAARVLGAGTFARLWRVHLPLVRGAVAAGFSIIFAEAIADFGVASTLAASVHFPLIPYAIYSSLSYVPVDFSGAAAQSLLLVLLALIVQLPQFFLARRALGVLHGHRKQWRLRDRVNAPATAAVAAFFFLALGVPLLSFLLIALVPDTGLGFAPAHWTLQSFRALLGGDIYTATAALRSFMLALLAAVLTTALGIWVMWAGTRLSALYDLLLTTTIAVPGVVLAAAYVFAWNAPWVQGTPLAIYGSYAALILVYVAGGLPYAGRLARVGLSQVDASLERAVLSLGGGSTRALWHVTLPLIRPMLMSTFLLMFTGVFFELPASTLLYPPGDPTIAVAIVHQFHNVADSIGAALTILSVLVIGAALGAFRLVDHWTRQRWRETREEVEYTAAVAPSLQVVRAEADSV